MHVVFQLLIGQISDLVIWKCMVVGLGHGPGLYIIYEVLRVVALSRRIPVGLYI